MKNAFETWIGQTVIVQMALGRVKLSLQGTLLRDGNETLLMRPQAGCEVEVPKANVLAIEEIGPSVPASALAFEKNSHNVAAEALSLFQGSNFKGNGVWML